MRVRADDADIELFHKVMLGTLDDDVYYDQMDMLENLRKKFTEFCIDERGKPIKKRPTKPELLGLVKEFFPYKGEDDLKELEDALNRDVPKKKGVVKQWKTLFEEDREGNQLAFVETLRDQHLSDRAVRPPRRLPACRMPRPWSVQLAHASRARISRNWSVELRLSWGWVCVQDYFEELEEAICAFDPEADGWVTIPEIKQAFAAVDPDKPEESVLAIMRRGLMRDRPKGSEGYPRSCIREHERMPPDDQEFKIIEFMQQIRAVNVSRSGPKQERKNLKPSMLDLQTEKVRPPPQFSAAPARMLVLLCCA